MAGAQDFVKHLLLNIAFLVNTFSKLKISGPCT